MHITEQICDTRPLEVDVERFEQQIGTQLPSDYREFLMKYNGGRPDPSGFSFTTRQGLREDSSVHYFFGIHTGRICNLERKLELRGERIPTEFVPIATDPFVSLP